MFHICFNIWVWVQRVKSINIVSQDSVSKWSDNKCCEICNVFLFFSFLVKRLVRKKVLKSSAFALKFVINLFSWNSGGIQGISSLFRKIFKMDRDVFELAARLANLLNNLEEYVYLEFSIDTFSWLCRVLNFPKRNTSLLKRQYDF